MSKTTKGLKPSQKPARTNGKVTDFFHIIPSSSRSPSSSQPSSSQPKAPLKQGQRSIQSALRVKKDNIPPKLDQEVISVSSGSHISISSDSVVCLSPRTTRSKSRVMMDAVEILSPRKTRASTVLSISSGSDAVVKHSRSPDPRALSRSPTKAAAPKPPSQNLLKRKKKFESDTESDPIESIVHVSRASVKPGSSSNFVRTPEFLSMSPQKSQGPLLSRENLTLTLDQASVDKPSPKKRLKAESEPEPAAAVQTDDEERVPSSQSDEQELSAPRLVHKDPQETKENIEQWRRSTSFVSSDTAGHDDARVELEPAPMDVDRSTEEGSISIGTMRSETEVSALLHTSATPSTAASVPIPLPPAEPEPEVFRPFTPPPADELPPLPATPEVVNAEARAREIIARAKAQAYAAREFSEEPETVPRNADLPDLSDSSSDAEEVTFDYFLKSRGPVKGPATPKSGIKPSLAATSPLTPLTTPLTGLSSVAPTPKVSSSRSPSPSSRSRSPSQGRRATRASTRLSRPGPSKAPVVLTKGKEITKPQKKKRGSNPLDSMLREKTLADKRGRGMSAMRDAEEAAASRGKDRMREEMEDEDEEMDLDDEDAALRAVVKGRRTGQSSSPQLDKNEDEESDGEIVDEKDRVRLLGEKNAKAVGAILEKDRQQKGKNKVKTEDASVGVKVFDTEVFAHDGNDLLALPTLSLEGHKLHPIMRGLKKAAMANDMSLARVYVEACVCADLDAAQLSALLLWLCETAFLPVFGEFSETCFQTLENMRDSLSNADALSVVPLMRESIGRLGARPLYLQIAGHDGDVVLPKLRVDSCARAAALYRMVNIVSLLAQWGAVSVEELPEMIVTLLLVGLDSSSTGELRRRVIMAVDASGRFWEEHSSDVSEQALCDRLICLASELTPANKTHLFSMLMCGSSLIASVARFVAYVVLIEANNAAVNQYAEAQEGKDQERLAPQVKAQPLAVPTTFTESPPLSRLMTLLSPPVASGALFDVSNQDIDYDQLGYYVEILSVALTNIDNYVAEERREAYDEPTPSPTSSPRKERKLMPLERIKNLVYSVHGKIVDTRAAHLERSRTKAALQRLAMRIHYQRMAALKSGPSAHYGGGPVRPRTLREHWKANVSVS